MTKKKAEHEPAWKRHTEICRHYNGVRNKKCKVGIKYPTPIPCMNFGGTPDVYGQCIEFSPWNEEEAKAKEEAAKKSFENIILAKLVIMEKEGKKRGVTGEINPCPICEVGILYYTIAGNGHVHAKCTREGCVFWME